MLKNSLPSIPLLQDVTDYARKWSEAGAQPVYDTAFASAIGGYPAGSVLQSVDGSGFWISTADNNLSDPDGAAPANWDPHVFHGAATIAVGAVDVVLRPKEYAKPNLVISGALSADVAVILPSLVRQWVVRNESVGDHQVTVKTASGQGVVLRPGSQMVWGDGSNILPVTSSPTVSGPDGHYVQSSGEGGLKDSHQSASDASNAYVVTSPGSLPVGHIAKIADANGSIGDGGALGSAAGMNASNASNAYAVTSPGSLPVGHIAKIADANGSIGDGGALGSAAGMNASNASNAYAVTSPGSLPVGHIAKIADANGSIGDGGALGSAAGMNASNASNAYAVTSPGSLPVGHIAKIADTNGSIGDGGALGSAAGLNASNASNAYAVTSPGSLPVGHIAKIADANGSIDDGGVLGSAAGLNASTVAAGAGLSSVYSFSGNPNGQVAGRAAVVGVSPPDLCWDAAEQILWICTLSGAAATAVWQKVGGANPVVSLSKDYVVSTKDQSVNFVATAAVSITLPQANSIANGACAFSLASQGGAVTIIPASADSIVVGQRILAVGASYVLAQGASAFVVCDGAGKWYLLSPSGPGLQTPAYRNRIINGDMRIDQRNAGAALTIVAGAAMTYTVDRWYAYCRGGNVTGQQVVTAAKRNRYQFSGAAGVTGISFGQRIEAINSLDMAGLTCTLSFRAVSTALTSLTWTAYYANSTDDFRGRTQIATGTVAISGAEAAYTASIDVPTTATTGIEIVFTVGALLAAQTLTIGDVQFETGLSATTFEVLPFDVQLQRCHRYFFRTNQIDNVSGYIASPGQPIQDFLYTFPVPMRVNPSLSLWQDNGVNASVSAPSITTNNFMLMCTGNGSGYTYYRNTFTMANAEL